MLVVLKSKAGLIFSARGMEENPWTDDLYEYLDKEVEGKVAILRRYGAFVDFANVRGLLHKSEMPWVGAEVKDCLYLGQIVRTKVISIDVASKSIGLSMAGLYKDPWRTVLELGETRDVNVVGRSEGGLIVNTADGLIGNIPEEECGWVGVPTLTKLINAGDKLQAKIISADHGSRKITFSVRVMSEAPWLDLTRACAYKTMLNAKIISISLKHLLLEILPGVFSSLEIVDLPQTVWLYHIGDSLCVIIRRISWDKPVTVKVVLAE